MSFDGGLLPKEPVDGAYGGIAELRGEELRRKRMSAIRREQGKVAATSRAVMPSQTRVRIASHAANTPIASNASISFSTGSSHRSRSVSITVRSVSRMRRPSVGLRSNVFMHSGHMQRWIRSSALSGSSRTASSPPHEAAMPTNTDEQN